MDRHRRTIRIALSVITIVILIHAVIAIGLLREGYRPTVVLNPLEWSYNHGYRDGAIVDHHRRFEDSRQYGFLNFTKGWTVRVD